MRFIHLKKKAKSLFHFHFCNYFNQSQFKLTEENIITKTYLYFQQHSIEFRE